MGEIDGLFLYIKITTNKCRRNDSNIKSLFLAKHNVTFL
jgi:hypothetical protein